MDTYCLQQVQNKEKTLQPPGNEGISRLCHLLLRMEVCAGYSRLRLAPLHQWQFEQAGTSALAQMKQIWNR